MKLAQFVVLFHLALFGGNVQGSRCVQDNLPRMEDFDARRVRHRKKAASTFFFSQLFLAVWQQVLLLVVCGRRRRSGDLHVRVLEGDHERGVHPRHGGAGEGGRDRRRKGEDVPIRSCKVPIGTRRYSSAYGNGKWSFNVVSVHFKTTPSQSWRPTIETMWHTSCAARSPGHFRPSYLAARGKVAWTGS